MSVKISVEVLMNRFHRFTVASWVMVCLGFAWASPSCPAQVWAPGISPQRAPNLIGALPAQPSRPSMSLPRFPNENILPTPVRLPTLPRSNFVYDNLRPSEIVDRAIRAEPMVRETILPPKIPRTIEGLGRSQREVLPTRNTFGSTIFLPAIPMRQSTQNRDLLGSGMMSLPGHRRSLGW
jgi:hypothetical protein